MKILGLFLENREQKSNWMTGLEYYFEEENYGNHRCALFKYGCKKVTQERNNESGEDQLEIGTGRDNYIFFEISVLTPLSHTH